MVIGATYSVAIYIHFYCFNFLNIDSDNFTSIVLNFKFQKYSCKPLSKSFPRKKHLVDSKL